MITIDFLKNNNLILLECISGSRAYNLHTPTSDTDIKGVFYLPKNKFYGLEYVKQVSNETNDIVYYELGRFIELLSKNNPNILELLATPESKTLIKHPIMDRITPELFLSKLCKDAFGGYAFSQVKKAKGLNKKISNPMDKKKKSILDFCYVLKNHGSVTLLKWLELNKAVQENIGLVNIANFKDTFAIFYDESGKLGYSGVTNNAKATTVLLSSIPKEEALVAYLQFNQDGYIKYCKDYKEYWQWVDKRNPDRYLKNVALGKNYDSKNMLHTFRLLNMAKEILETGEIIVERPDREYLLDIKNGKWSYEELLEMADEKMFEINTAFKNSQLPDNPDMRNVEKLLVEIRDKLYS